LIFPFSDLSRYIFPFRKPQVVLKIGKKITALTITWNAKIGHESRIGNRANSISLAVWLVQWLSFHLITSQLLKIKCVEFMCTLVLFIASLFLKFSIELLFFQTYT
jgi:hypothetical protein